MNIGGLLQQGPAVGMTVFALIAIALALLLLAMVEVAALKPRNHLRILASSALAFGMVVRMGALWNKPEAADWTMVMGWGGLAGFLLFEPGVRRRLCQAWHRLTGASRRYSDHI